MGKSNFTEVKTGIYQFKGVSNFYLVQDSESFVVDTGLPGKAGQLENCLKSLGKNPEDIGVIVLTHHHFDHTGSLNKIEQLTKARIAAHKDDWPYVSGEKSDDGPFFMKPITKLMNIIYNIKPVKTDMILKEGDKIADYTVIHTPGHTPGSICLYNPLNKVLFVGDNLSFSNGVLNSPSGRLLPDPAKYKKSMEKLGELDVETILTGHGEPVTTDANRLIKEFITT
jgi:glyoxylase-like metal-dependent hydrolase (beta-lactamase superfamily II)